MPSTPAAPKTETDRLRNKLRKLEARAAGEDYLRPEHISYVAKIGELRAFFLTQDRVSYNWFHNRAHPKALHEPVLTRALLDSLTRDSVFLDIGANLGYFTVIAALRARAVVAIEPQEGLIGRIHANVAANHLDNVTLIHAAAGAAPGFARIPKFGTPRSKIGESENHVLMIRLDDYFTGDWQPTHIKIDTEGFEHHVLLGAEKLLATQPRLYVEYHKGMEQFGFSGTEMWDLLKDHGYHITAARHRARDTEHTEVLRDELHQYEGQMMFCHPRDNRGQDA